MRTTVKCDCGHDAKPEGCTTGYGIDRLGKTICFLCCGEMDKKQLIETGKLSGYLVKEDGRYYFTNWPGTLKINVLYYRQSWHNFAGRNGRTDFWLSFNGHNWHGVQIGHFNQCATVRRVKA